MSLSALPDLPPSGRGADYDLAQRLAVHLIVDRRQRLLVRDIMTRHGVRYLSELPEERLLEVIQSLQETLTRAGVANGETFDVRLPVEQRLDD